MTKAKNLLKQLERLDEQKVTITIEVDDGGVTVNNGGVTNVDTMNNVTKTINPASKFVMPSFSNPGYDNQKITLLWNQFLQDNQIDPINLDPDMIRAFANTISKSNYYSLDIILRWAKDYFSDADRQRIFL